MKACGVVVCALLMGCVVEDPTALVQARSLEQGVISNPNAGAAAAPGDYDGDHCTDISVKGSNGIWYIDLCANGFGGRWDFAYPGYGDATATPVPADYDGDGITDISVKDTTGFWGVDYAWNGFGTWDVMAYGYGFANAVPCPADYDGDGLADMSIKDSTGFWGIDFAYNGFTGFNNTATGYGNETWVPVPGKYDSDAKADRAIKTANGEWFIDDSSNGHGRRLCSLCPLTLWDHTYTGYGNGAAIPNAADYDSDGHADLSVTGANWYIDSWAPNYSYGAWDYPNTGYPGHSSLSMTAVPGDYNGDGQTDLAWKDNTNGYWYIDYRHNGYSMSWPYYDRAVDVAYRQHYNPAQPYISDTKIYAPDGTQLVSGGAAQLTIGVRYNVAVVVHPGQNDYNAGVEVNPALRVPKTLLENHFLQGAADWITNISCTSNSQCPGLPTRFPECNLSTNRCNAYRWFSITCSEPGSFPLGFQMRDAVPDEGGTGNAFNPDHGIRVFCTSPSTGLYGRVTQRVLTGGVYKPGTTGIDGVSVSVAGHAPVVTANGGHWALPNVTGGPHRVTLTPPGTQFSGAVAVNVTVPPGQGVRIDTPLEKAFILPPQSVYTTFIDYSRGRTVFHTVEVPTPFASAKLDLPPKTSSGVYKTLVQTANELGASARVVVNGGYFAGGPVGYFNSITSAPNTFGYVPSWLPDGGPGRMYQTNASAQAPRITLELTRYGSGAAIPVSYEGLAATTDERIVLAPVGAPLSSVTAIGTPLGRSGRLALPGVPPGTYVARVLRNNNTVLTAQSATFGVGRAGGEVRVSTDTMYYLPGGGVLALYRALPAAGYSIGIAVAGSPLSTPPLQSTPVADTTGQVWLSAPAAAGLYEMRAYAPGLSVVAASDTFTVAQPIEPELTAPLLAISGAGLGQFIRIVQNTPANFESAVDPWTMYGSSIPLYDTNPRDNVSDISFGLQSWPTVLAAGKVIAREHPDAFRFDAAWARTAVGVKGNRFFVVVADGEGIHGRHGATFNQLGEFFRDALFATDAMNFDGGLSTELVLWDSNGPRHVNTLTGEDGRISINPFTQALPQIAGGIGSVENYLRVGQ